MLGTAREVGALTGHTVHPPKIEYQAAGMPVDSLIGLEIVDPELCPRYTAVVVRGVTIGQSPEWIAERLIAAGVRPINNVVDVSNYVMLETNQPLHTFDYDKIRGKRIVVRRRDEERMTTLDSQERESEPRDARHRRYQGPIAIAGVIGGLDTEVSSETTNILIESANFPDEHSPDREGAPPAERGVSAIRARHPGRRDRDGRRGGQLIQQLAGGEIAPGIADAYPTPVERREIVLTPAEVRRVLGMDFRLDEMTRVLVSLGYEVAEQEGALRDRSAVPC